MWDTRQWLEELREGGNARLGRLGCHALLAGLVRLKAVLLGGHWTTALQMLQVVVKGSGAEGASARVVGDLAWAALASASALALT